MLTMQKERKDFIIRSNFLRMTFHEGVLLIQQSNLSTSQSEIAYLQMQELPSFLAHLFNSVRHVYNYLTGRPQSIIQVTEQQTKFVVDVHGNIHICCLPLMRLKLSEDAFWLRKKSYEASIKMQEFNISHDQMQKECDGVRKRARQAVSKVKMEREKLSQAEALQQRLLQDLQKKRQEKTELEQLLRQKQHILQQIKTRQGTFVSLDD